MATIEKERSFPGADAQFKIQSELGFRAIENGSGIEHDGLIGTTDFRQCEVLPTRTRVTEESTRLEFAVRKIDLERYLELIRLAGEIPADTNAVKHFWPEGSRFTAQEDDEWLYVGAAIEPTAEDFEKQFFAVQRGLSVAIGAASVGETYDQAVTDSRLALDVRFAETIAEQPTQALFWRTVQAEQDGNEIPFDCQKDRYSENWDRTAENLAACDLTKHRFITSPDSSIHINDKIIEHVGSSLHIDDEPSSVRFAAYWDDPSQEDMAKVRQHLAVEIPIPPEVSVQTVADLAKLNRAQVWMAVSETEPQSNPIWINIEVDKHEVHISSEAKDLDLLFCEPQCTNCRSPYWKFPWPPLQVLRQGNYDEGYVMPITAESQNNIFAYSYASEADPTDKQTYCYPCISEVRSAFSEEHPFALRQQGLKALRSQLDTLGYQDVGILAEATRVTPEGSDGDVEFSCYIDYERDGRMLRRYIARPTLSYDGQINLKLPAREVVDFR